ncbi:hypothetical protein FI667_g13085, partial [Globisporangium splendens]
MRAAVETTRILRRSGYAGVPLRRMMADVAASTAAADTPVVGSLLWKDVANIDASRCIDPLVRESDLRVMQDVVTEEEELVVAEECMKILKRRRYEEDHWDQVIVKFKEMERSRWSTELTKKHAIACVWLRIETKRILDRLREVPILPQGLEYFPAVHVIDLAEDGYIKPHVDSIKFSGRVVAGVSLLSPSIMRFKEEHGESIIDAFLPRRSFYVMTYADSIFL